jgi:hypothetical protein
MHFDPDKVQRNARRAATEDLLDRVTVYRAGMEPEAVRIIIAELLDRGITPEMVAEHAAERFRRAILLPDGTAAPCSFCFRPAVAEGRDWHRLWGLVPVFVRTYRYCSLHYPGDPPR